QVRIVETRAAVGTFGYRRISKNLIRVRVAGLHGVPLNATAVVVNISAVAGKAAGSITAFPTGTALTAHWNVVTDAPAQTAADLATVKIGANGSIDLFHTAGMQMTIDLVGAYAPVSGGVADGRLHLMSSPRAALSGLTLGAHATRIVDLKKGGVPIGAKAAVVLITVANPAKGFWTAYTYGTRRPNTTTIPISVPGRTVSHETIVEVNAANPRMTLFTSNGGKATVTVLGWYTGTSDAPSGEGLFVPAVAHRRLRTSSGRLVAPFGPVTFEFSSGANFGVQGLVANVLTLDNWDAGPLIARPAGVAYPFVPVSTAAVPRQRVAAHAMLRTSTRGVALSSAKGSNVTVDVVGWFLGPRPVATLPVPKVPVVRSTKVVGVIWRTASGPHSRAVNTPATTSNTNLNPIADSGNGAAYLARSTLGQPGNVMVFGHRTVHGAMFRDLNTVRLGDEFMLVGANGKRYHYRVMSKTVTGPSYRTISAITLKYPPITAQLVACSKPDGTPTNVNYRIVVTGMLVAVT
ncbi:MAG: hypothetical protein RJA49_1451, partial [Actinomycetota bacterium]